MKLGIDLKRSLDRERTRSLKNGEEATLWWFKEQLEKEDVWEDRILKNLKSSEETVGNIALENLDLNRVYTLENIKAICTRYRLRFLDTSLFKGEIPYEAIMEIKKLERENGLSLKGMKIIAPATLFHLAEKDKDPLLMLPLGDDRFYLIHKWGNDLHPLRRLFVFPFQSFKTLVFSIAALAFLIVMSVPNSVMLGPYDKNTIGIRAIFFIYLFIALSGLSLLYGFSRVKNFNSALWQSRYTD